MVDRLERIDELLEYIRTEKSTKVSRILGIFGLKYGLREDTLLSYLRQLESAGKIKLSLPSDTAEIVE